MNDKIYNVGIYVRLSNDDERSGESVSIENQKMRRRNGTAKIQTVKGLSVEIFERKYYPPLD